MKRIGIHQINYFPWIGYYNKMAKSDVFVYLDEVQLSDRGLSQRSPLVNSNANVTYITVGVDKRGHREKEFKDIQLNMNTNWQETHYNFLRGNYSKHPFYKEIMGRIEGIFFEKYTYLIDVNLRSVECIKDILGIETEIVRQSDLEYDRGAKKNELMLALTRACNGDVYLSGNGARKYMQIQDFEDFGVKVQYLTFAPFEYTQYRSGEFIPGLSTLDLLFNVGVKKARDLFWENIQRNEVFEQINY